jgi:3-oxoacyl-[acyl-carrier protein] reductase
MDLGIKGKRAIVCASSKGLGRGCAEALAAAGVHLVMNARGGEALHALRPTRSARRMAWT